LVTLELKIIMIDLDETLIHSEDYTYGNIYDFVFEMDNPAIAPKKDVAARLT
jgi:predicted HAD superfamily phosphohydrolase YqeG